MKKVVAVLGRGGDRPGGLPGRDGLARTQNRGELSGLGGGRSGADPGLCAELDRQRGSGQHCAFPAGEVAGRGERDLSGQRCKCGGGVLLQPVFAAGGDGCTEHGHYHPYLSAQGEGLPIQAAPDGHAFIQDGETAYQLTYENNELCFQQIANLPPTLEPVYCRVYTSQDGSSYQLAQWEEISVLPLRDIQNINAVEGHYTRCRAQLPAGTGWVQVRVDQRLAPLKTPSYCLLASVKLEGNTVLGPVPVQPEPDPEEPQESGGNRGSGGASDEKDEERMIRTIRPGSVIQAGGGAAAAAPKPLEESTNRVVEPIYPEQKEPAQETAQLDVPEDSWDEGYFYDEFGGAGFPAEEEGGRSWLMGAAYLGVLAAVIGFLLLRRGSGRRKG